MHARRGSGAVRGLAAGVGLAALVAVCCAGLPLLAVLVGGLTLGALLGVSGGVVGAVVLVGVATIMVRARGRRRCAKPPR